jgi:hypothetical protein
VAFNRAETDRFIVIHGFCRAAREDVIGSAGPDSGKSSPHFALDRRLLDVIHKEIYTGSKHADNRFSG